MMANQPAWMTTKRPAHLTTRQPRKSKPRQPSNVSLTGVLWTTLFLTFGAFFAFT
tara:strand:- start:770 stop:934 length:165 start_codon:yes stop_codon:yes gene_type:complete